MLDGQESRNKLRSIVNKAQSNNVIQPDEGNFVITLVDRFRADIEKKIKQLNILQGEISQLKINERIIIELIENLIAAAERDEARKATEAKLKEAREDSSSGD